MIRSFADADQVCLYSRRWLTNDSTLGRLWAWYGIYLALCCGQLKDVIHHRSLEDCVPAHYMR